MPSRSSRSAGREHAAVTGRGAAAEARRRVCGADPLSGRAERLVGGAPAVKEDDTLLRVGIGFDAHGFAPERPLILGGVRLRERDGLLGHSDADVLAHAIMDALLGAAGLEDIGALFPDSDPDLAGADSLELLASVARRLDDQGWALVNVDAVVVCEEPRIAPHRAAMRRRLATAMGVSVERVSLRGTTTEGMGFTGRGEGIAAQAVALIRGTARGENMTNVQRP